MNEYTAEEQLIANQNAAGKSNFDFACKGWLNNPVGPKPVSPASRVVLFRQYAGENVAWIAEADGDVYGLCPDPATTVTPPMGGGKITDSSPSATEPALADVQATVHKIFDLLTEIASGQPAKPGGIV